MKLKTIYIRILSVYVFLLILSGILLEFHIAHPGYLLLGPFNFALLKFFHRNVFLYGILLNALPGFLLFCRDRAVKKTYTRILFWLYQGSLFTGWLGAVLGFRKGIRYFEFEWLASFFVFLCIVLILITVRNEFKTSGTKRYAWVFYILFPITAFLIFFIFLNASRPVNLLDSVSLLSNGQYNFFTVEFNLFWGEFFLSIFAFGLLYINFAKDSELFLKRIQLQWTAQLLIFTGLVFFQTRYFVYREFTRGWSVLFSVFMIIPWIIGYKNISYLQVLADKTDKTAGNTLNYIKMFLFIFILGFVFSHLPFLRELYTFTGWEVGQTHLLLSGFLLPAFYLFTAKNLKIITPRILTLAWSVTTLILVFGKWFIATIEAALWDKRNAFGYLDYPGWNGIEKLLHPYQAFLLYLLLISIFSFGVWYYSSPREWKIKE